jgi:hypothetical protein
LYLVRTQKKKKEKLVIRKYEEEVYRQNSPNRQKCEGICVPCEWLPKGDFNKGGL